MNDVPSSAIIMIASTVIAAILMTVLLYTYRGQRDIENVKNEKIQEMNQVNLETDYATYIGSTIRGDKLRGYIKACEGGDIIIYVQNGVATAKYDFRTDNFSITALKDSGSADSKTKASQKESRSGDFYTYKESANTGLKENVYSLMTNRNQVCWFIAPFDSYYCTGEMKYGAVNYLVFARQ